MKTLRPVYPLPLICRVLEVSRSGYYAWLKRPPSKQKKEEGRLEVEIKAAHKRTRKTCGPERLQKDLAAHGVKVGICRIRRIRKKLGIRCKQIKKFKATTDSRHSLPVAENLLEQQFEVEAPKAPKKSPPAAKKPVDMQKLQQQALEIFGGEWVSAAPGKEEPE